MNSCNQYYTRWSRPALLLALSLSLGLGACEKQLDLQPLQSVDADTALDSEQKVTSAVVGMYAKLGNPALYGTNLILLPELMGGDGYVNWRGTFQSYREIRTRSSYTSINTEAERVWRRAYEAINQANLVLDALPVVSTAALKRQYEGEARFIRAAMYFELVRLYAQQYQPGQPNSQLGVPISLVAVKTLEQSAVRGPRATVAEVYNQVISDLRAIVEPGNGNSLLPDNNGTRASKYAAEALLARVYLQQSNFTEAGRWANDVIENSGKSLSPTLAAVFTNRNSQESLFEIQQNDQNNAGTANDGLATFFASDGGVGRGDVQVTGGFASQYEDSDVRGTDSLNASNTRKLIYLGDGARPNQLRTIKWRTFAQNIPVIRLGEMYLIRAEAQVRTGNVDDALRDVNLIRSRSGASELTTVTAADVLRERRLELAFEGFRIHDFKRTNTNPISSLPITDPKLLLPIPQREINVNELLTQNPGF